MNVIGVPNAWINLIDTMVPDILKLVTTTWEALPPPASDAYEDPITELLCLALKQNRDLSELPFRIDIQLVELEPEADQKQGRMDIAFSPLIPREDIYFCLECKRLNVIKDGTLRKYASQYVTHGMVRFITGQYSKLVKHGGMLGYVLDGKVDNAIDDVSSVIHKSRDSLGMLKTAIVEQSSIIPTDNRIKETRHKRPHNGQEFKIHHIFVAGTEAI